MPNISISEMITFKNKRLYMQDGGPWFDNPVLYAGVQGQYASLGGVENPVRGDISPIRVHSLSRFGGYDLVGRTEDAPDLPTAELTLWEKFGYLPKAFSRPKCPINIYVLTGNCKTPSDFNAGWTSGFVEVYSQGLVTNNSHGDRVMPQEDGVVQDVRSLTLSDIYAIGSIGFGDKAAAQSSLEFVDGVYGTAVECGSCGPENDGTLLIYHITASSGGGSPGLPAEVIYTVDGGQTWEDIDIENIGTDSVVAIDIVGQKLVVVSDTGTGAIYWADIDPVTGIPGTFTKVTTGLTYAPNDIYVATPSEIYLCADSGRIFKSTNIEEGFTLIEDGNQTVENLNRIHGVNEVIVAVGDNATTVVSLTRGLTFALVNNHAGTNATSVWVTDRYKYVVGDDSGGMYYTVNGGSTWTLKSIPNATNIKDIVFASPEVIHVAYIGGGKGKLTTSFNGGFSFTTAAPRIAFLPVTDAINRIAVPTVTGDPFINANNLSLSCKANASTDGIILLGTVATL
jgi:hypothetical protein